MSERKLFAMAAGILLLSASAWSGTVTLFDSSAGAPAGSDSIAQFGPLYDSFSTPSGQAVGLSDVQFVLQNQGGGANPPASAGISVGLYSNNSLKPGSLLLTLGMVANSSLPPVEQTQTYSFALSPTFSLAAGTRYWIGFTSAGGSDAGLVWTENDGGPGVASEYNIYDGTLYSNTSGPDVLKITGMTSGSMGGGPTVPEPASALLVLTGVVAAFVGLRRPVSHRS